MFGNSLRIPNITLFGCKKGCKSCKCLIYTLYCGERGIRTPGTSQFNGFQDRRNRPLCHLSSRFQHVLQSFCSQLRCKGKDYFRICKFSQLFFLCFSQEIELLIANKLNSNIICYICRTIINSLISTLCAN